MVHDLDIGYKEKEIVKFCGKEFDISFIPAGVSIPLLVEYDKWINITYDGKAKSIDKIQKEMETNLDKAKENAEQICKVVSVYVGFYFKEMTYEWLMQNVDLNRISQFMMLLVSAIMKYIKSSGSGKKKIELSGQK